MTREEEIKQELENKFAYLKDKVLAKRERRIFLDLGQENFEEVFNYLVKQMQFTILHNIVGMDEGGTFGVIYHLSKDGKGILSLKMHISGENPIIKTITHVFPNAEIYERELVDLLGMKVEGLPAGNRYPLPDGWPENEFPLRKDWKQNVAAETKGVDKNG